MSKNPSYQKSRISIYVYSIVRCKCIDRFSKFTLYPVEIEERRSESGDAQILNPAPYLGYLVHEHTWLSHFGPLDFQALMQVYVDDVI